MAGTLIEQSCTPCRGGIPPLSIGEATRCLDQAPAWNLLDDGGQIQRTFWFSNFRESLGFARDVGELAEAERHHPDVAFGWGYATISLRTKKIRGLHQNDFIMAAKIDRLATAAGAQDNRGQNRRSGGHPEGAPVTSDTTQSNDNRGSTLTHPS
jgi:4a-hydroxytetrahydrobiopterin dehydratase